MLFSVWMAAGAIILFVFGVLFINVPAWMLSLYGISADAVASLMSSFFGSAFVFLALLLWYFRDATDPVTQRRFGIAAFVGNLAGLAVSLRGVLDGISNALGWLNVALYVIFALGLGYFALPKRTG